MSAFVGHIIKKYSLTYLLTYLETHFTGKDEHHPALLRRFWEFSAIILQLQENKSGEGHKHINIVQIYSFNLLMT